MQTNQSSIVQKLWNSACLATHGADRYCNGPGLGQSLARSPACEQAVVRKQPRLALRDDLSACGHAQAGGMSYGDYVEAAPAHSCARGIRASCSSRLTYLLFGSGVTSRVARYKPMPQQAGRPACCLKMADERTKAPYNQKSPVPAKYSWSTLLDKDGDELFDHYRKSRAPRFYE